MNPTRSSVVWAPAAVNGRSHGDLGVVGRGVAAGAEEDAGRCSTRAAGGDVVNSDLRRVGRVVGDGDLLIRRCRRRIAVFLPDWAPPTPSHPLGRQGRVGREAAEGGVAGVLGGRRRRPRPKRPGQAWPGMRQQTDLHSRAPLEKVSRGRREPAEFLRQPLRQTARHGRHVFLPR